MFAPAVFVSGGGGGGGAGFRSGLIRTCVGGGGGGFYNNVQNQFSNFKITNVVHIFVTLLGVTS